MKRKSSITLHQEITKCFENYEASREASNLQYSHLKSAVNELDQLIKGGDLLGAEFFLNQNISILFSKDHNRTSTAIHVAAKQGYLEVIKFIFSLKPELANNEELARVNHLDYKQPIIYAVEKGHIDIVNFFLSTSPETINTIEKYSEDNLLNIAIKHGQINLIIRLLYAKPTMIYHINGEGINAFHVAFKANINNITVKDNILDLLFLIKPDLLSSVDKSNTSILHHAGAEGNIKIASLCLKFDCTFIDSVNNGYITPLMCAAGNNHRDMVQMLQRKMVPDVVIHNFTNEAVSPAHEFSSPHDGPRIDYTTSRLKYLKEFKQNFVEEIYFAISDNLNKDCIGMICEYILDNGKEIINETISFLAEAFFSDEYAKLYQPVIYGESNESRPNILNSAPNLESNIDQEASTVKASGNIAEESNHL